MYKPPEDIITDLLKEDIGVDIRTPTGVNVKTEPEENDLDVRIQGDTEVNIKPQISIDIVNKNSKTTTFEMNIRKSLNGDFLIFDHADIDIVIMPTQNKVLTFPKETMTDAAYGAQNRLFTHLKKKGIVIPESIQGGSYYGAMEAQLQENVEVVKGNTSTILPLTLSLSIYGISSIIPGDIFKVDYLPERYKNIIYFQVMKVSHELNSSTWTTTLETQFRLRKIFK